MCRSRARARLVSVIGVLPSTHGAYRSGLPIAIRRAAAAPCDRCDDRRGSPQRVAEYAPGECWAHRHRGVPHAHRSRNMAPAKDREGRARAAGARPLWTGRYLPLQRLSRHFAQCARVRQAPGPRPLSGPRGPGPGEGSQVALRRLGLPGATRSPGAHPRLARGPGAEAARSLSAPGRRTNPSPSDVVSDNNFVPREPVGRRNTDQTNSERDQMKLSPATRTPTARSANFSQAAASRSSGSRASATRSEGRSPKTRSCYR